MPRSPRTDGTPLLRVEGEVQAAVVPSENPPLPASPGPPTETGRPWEGSPGPEGAAEGSPVPVAAGSRSGAAAGGTGWQPWAGCRVPRGGANACDRRLSGPASSSPSPLTPRAASALSAPGCCAGLTTRAQGECTALGSWWRGVPSGLEGLPWPLSVSPFLGVPGPFPEVS